MPSLDDILRRLDALESQVGGDEALTPNYLTVDPTTGLVSATFAGGLTIVEGQASTIPATASFINAVSWVRPDGTLAAQIYPEATLPQLIQKDLLMLSVRRRVAPGGGGDLPAEIWAEIRDSSGGIVQQKKLIDSLGNSAFLQVSGDLAEIAAQGAAAQATARGNLGIASYAYGGTIFSPPIAGAPSASASTANQLYVIQCAIPAGVSLTGIRVRPTGAVGNVTVYLFDSTGVVVAHSNAVAAAIGVMSIPFTAPYTPSTGGDYFLGVVFTSLSASPFMAVMLSLAGIVAAYGGGNLGGNTPAATSIAVFPVLSTY